MGEDGFILKVMALSVVGIENLLGILGFRIPKEELVLLVVLETVDVTEISIVVEDDLSVVLGLEVVEGPMEEDGSPVGGADVVVGLNSVLEEGPGELEEEIELRSTVESGVVIADEAWPGVMVDGEPVVRLEGKVTDVAVELAVRFHEREVKSTGEL